MNYTEFTKRKLEQHYLVQFKESTGEIVQTLSGIGNAMLKTIAKEFSHISKIMTKKKIIKRLQKSRLF